MNKRYFGGPYIPLYPTAIVCFVFFCMFMISNWRWEQREKERDQALAQMEEVRIEISKTRGSIQTVLFRIYSKERQLHNEYDDMLHRPPLWPPNLLAELEQYKSETEE